jgi:hypothetical protein
MTKRRQISKKNRSRSRKHSGARKTRRTRRTHTRTRTRTRRTRTTRTQRRTRRGGDPNGTNPPPPVRLQLHVEQTKSKRRLPQSPPSFKRNPFNESRNPTPPAKLAERSRLHQMPQEHLAPFKKVSGPVSAQALFGK